MGIGGWLALSVFATTIVNYIAEATGGRGLQSIMSSPTADTADVRLIQLSLLLTQLLAFAGPAVLMARLSGRPRYTLAASLPARVPPLILAGLMAIASIPVIQLAAFDSESFSLPEDWGELERSLKASEAQAERMLRKLFGHDLWSNLIVIGLVPAVCEELFFRGFLQRTFRRRMNPHVAILLTGLIFSLIHFQFFGFFSRWLMGIFFGYLVFWGGALWPAIAAHFAFNGFQAVLAHMAYTSESVDEAMVEENPEFPLMLTLGGVVLVAGGLALFRKFFHRPTEVPPESDQEPPQAGSAFHETQN